MDRDVNPGKAPDRGLRGPHRKPWEKDPTTLLCTARNPHRELMESMAYALGIYRLQATI